MGITRVPVPVETRSPTGRTNAYVVASGTGLLVDPAGPSEALEEAVRRVAPAHVAVTHTHRDHVGGVAAFATADRTVWARAGRTERFERATGVSVDRTFREGSAVGPATVVETPGHAPDHVAFALPAGVDDPAGEALIVGDLAVAAGSVLVDDVDGDLRSYLASLRRLLVRSPAVCYPGHGPTITDPVATLQRLIARRRDREQRVLAAVRDGARTPREIVAAAYDRDLGEAADLAALAVRAHLEKLAVEGRVIWDGERAQPT